MAQNKGAIVRYRAIDRCLRNRHIQYGWEQLKEACEKELYNDFSEHISVSRRQIFQDLNYMESDAGYSADIERIKDGHRTYYRYADPNFSIEKMPLNDTEMQQLQETILMLNRYKGMPHFEWMEEILSKLEDSFHLKGNTYCVIGFDQNIDLKGIEFISPLFEAIINKQVLNIQYQSFKSNTPQENIVHPYFLKQYNNRWFLFGLTTTRNQITNFALDRIIQISELQIPYIAQPAQLDFDTYFDDVIGVSIPKNKTPETIVLQFAPERYPYICNKPLHPTQHCYDNECKISIQVIPNNELISLILSFGSQVKVIEPQCIVDKIKSHVEQLNHLYL